MANWRKAVGWTAVGVGAVFIAVILGAFFVLRSQSFHRWALAKIAADASQSTGARVEIQNFAVHLKTLTADVYGLTVHGVEAPREKPLLQIQHATVGVRILSILQRKMNLSQLLVDNPVVNLTVTKDGHSNLPTPPPSNNKSSTNVFDLGIGHVAVTNGEIFVRDRKLPVYANLYGLHTEIKYSQLGKKYSGQLGYDKGTIYYGALRPLPHALQANFDASPSELNLNPLVLGFGGSRVQVEVSIRDYSSAPIASGRYNVLVHTQDFSGLSTTSAAGDVVLAGTMNYRDVAKQPLVRNAKLNGDVNSNGLAVQTEQAAVKIEKLSGRYELKDGNLKAEGFAFNLLNGTLKADGTIQHVDARPQSRFHLALAAVSLQAVKSSLRSYADQQIPVNGTLNAQVNATWAGSIATLKASSSVQMNGALMAANKQHSEQFPLNANVEVNYDGPRNLISVPQGNIQLPATTVTAHGEIGNNSNLAIQAISTNLHQLMLLATTMKSSGAGQSSPPNSLPNLHGALTLTANVRGTMQNPQVTAQLSATKLQVNQGQFGSLQLAVAASPSEVTVQNGSLTALPHGQVQFSAHAGLRHWSYVASDSIHAALQVRQMPLDMLDQLATKSYPISGELNGNIQLSGSELNPTGQGRLEISKARVQGEPLSNVVLQFTASGGTIHSQVSERTNQLILSFTPKTKAYQLSLDLPPQELSKLHAVQARNLPVKGKFGVTANGAGTIDNPQLNASISVQQLQVRDATVSQVKLNLAVANHTAKFMLASSGGPADLHGGGMVRLSPGYYTEASLDTSKFPLDPLLAMYMPSRPNGLSAETELHASIRGPLADTSKVEAHLTIPSFEAHYQQLQLATTGPLRVDYANSVVTLQPGGLQGTGTSFQFQGRLPLNSGGRINLAARGAVDLRLAQMIDPELQSGGKITLDVNAGGTLKSPGMNGQIKIVNAAFATEAAPFGVSNLNAIMQVNDTGVQITDATADLGGGQLKFGGSFLYRPQLQANVTISGKSVRLRYPEGMRTVFDADLSLNGNSQASTLDGRVLVDSISFTSDFDPSSFMGQFTGTSAPPTGQSFADNLKLQIAVQSSSQLSAGTAQLGIEGAADLRVVGTASDPVIVGRTDIASGDLFFEKRQYHLEQGVINFVNPNKTDPVMNLTITTTINQYNISIRLTGPIEKLQTSYVSDPPLPPTDIIKLVAFGTTPGAPESFGASSILAQGLGEVESTAGAQVSKLTGVSGLQIDPLIGGNNANPSARIGMQKRVTRNFLFTFSTDVTQPQNEIVQGEYQLNKRWSVSVVRNESGGVAVDGRFHTNF